MKIAILLMLSGAVLLPAQTPEESTPDSAIVAKTASGKEFTAGEIRKMIQDFPPQVEKSLQQNPADTLGYLLLNHALVEQAVKDGLDKKPDFEQWGMWYRLDALAKAELERYRASYKPTDEEAQQYYDQHSAQWEQAKFRAIYVAFTAKPGAPTMKVEEAARQALLKKPGDKPANATPPDAAVSRTQAEAKLRIEDLRKQLDNGATFEKLAEQYSDDKASAAKGGDFGSIDRASAYPEPLKNAIFALKPDQVSEPQSQPNGFYLFKLESITKQPFSEVKSRILRDLPQQHFSAWMKGLEEKYKVNVIDPEYFAGRASR